MSALRRFYKNAGASDMKLAPTWHARRDSNPQHSEPESDALSIELRAHFLKRSYSITGFLPVVKGEFEKIFELEIFLCSLTPAKSSVHLAFFPAICYAKANRPTERRYT